MKQFESMFVQKTGHGRSQPQQRRGNNSFSNNPNSQENDLGLNDELQQAQRINTQLLQDLKEAKDQVMGTRIEKERIERKMDELQKQLRNWRNRPQKLRNRDIGVSSPLVNKAKTRSSRTSSAMIDQQSKSYKRPTSSTGSGASQNNPLSIQYQNQEMKLKIKSLQQQIHRTNRSLSRQSRTNNINMSQPIDVTARQLSDENDEMRGRLRKTIVLVKKFFLSFRRLQRALHKRQQDDISKFKVQFQACRHELRDYAELIERGLDECDEENKKTRNNKATNGALSFQDKHNISNLSLTSNNNPLKIRAYRGDQQYISAEHSNSTPTSKQAQNLMGKTLISQQQALQSPPLQLKDPGLIQNQVIGISSTINQSQSDNLQQQTYQQSNDNLEQRNMAEQLRRQLESVMVEHRQAQDQIRILKGQNNDLIKQLSKNAAQIQQKVLDLQHKQNEQKQLNDIKMVENQQLQDQIDELAKSNEEFRRQILQLSQRDSKSTQIIQNLQIQNQSLKSNEQSSILQFKQNLIEKIDMIEQPLFEQINQLENLVQQKLKVISQLQVKIKSLSKQSVGKIKKLEKDLADTNVKQSQGKKQMKQLVEQLGTLHKKRNQELKANDSDKKKVNEALDKANNMVKSLQTQNLKLKSISSKEQNDKIKSLVKQNNQSSTIIKSLNSENQKLINENSKQKSQKAKIKQNLQKTVQDLKKQAANLKNDGQKKVEQNKKIQQAYKKKENQLKKAKEQIIAAEKKLKQHEDDRAKNDQSAKVKLNQYETELDKLMNIIKSFEQGQANEKQKSKQLQKQNNAIQEQALKLKSFKQNLEKDHQNVILKNQSLQQQLSEMESMMKKQESDKNIKINEIMKKISDYQSIIKQRQNQKQKHIQQSENAKKQFDEVIEKMSIENNMKIDQLIQTMQKQHEKDLEVVQSSSNSKYQQILNQQTSKLKAQLQAQLLEAEKSLKQSQDQVSKQQLQQINRDHIEELKLNEQKFQQKVEELVRQIEALRQQNLRLRFASQQQEDKINQEIDSINKRNLVLCNEIQNLQKEISDNTIASLSEKQKLHTLLNKTQASHEKELQEQQDLQASFKKQHNELAQSLKDRVKELQTQLAESEEQLIELEKKLMNQKNADKQSLEAQHKKEFEEQRFKNAEQRKKWDDEKQQLIQEKLQAVKNLKNQFRQENDKLLKLQSDSKDQQQQNMLKQLSKRDQQIDQLSNQMVNLKLKQSSLQSQIDEDQIKLQEKQSDIESFKKKLEKSQAECKEIQAQKIKIQEENLDAVNQLKKDISQKDNLIEVANTQLQEYNMQKMFIKTSLKDLIKDCSIIANESGSFAEESFNADLDFQAIIKALRQEIDDLRQRVDDQSKLNISKLTENSARFHQEEVKKENELKNIRQKNDIIKKQNSRLKEQLKQAKILAEQSKLMLAKAQDNFENLRKQTETSESKKQKYKERLNVLESQVNQEKKKSQQIKKEQDKQFQELSSSHQEKAQSLKEMWQKMDKLKNQNQGLNKQNAGLIQKNKKLKTQKQKVELQLQKKEQERVSAETELKAYQSLSGRDMNKKDQEVKQLKADNQVLKRSLQQFQKKQVSNFHDIIKQKSQKELQILRRASYAQKSWILVEQSAQKYLWIPQFELTKDQQRLFSQSVILQEQISQIKEDLDENYFAKIKELMQEKNQLVECSKRGSDPGGFIGSFSIGGQNLDKQQIKDKMRANAAEIEILKLKKKIYQLAQLIKQLPNDGAAKQNVKTIVQLREQNERLGERYDKLQKELTNIEIKIEKNITPRAAGGSMADEEEMKTPDLAREPMSQASDMKPPKRPASVRAGQLRALSPGASYVEQRPGTEVAPGEQFLFEQQSAMSIRSGSQAFQDIQTLMKRLQESEREIKESQNTQDLILASNRQLKKVILALEKKLKKISNKQGEAAIQHGRSVLAKFLKGCPYASKQLQQILIVAMNVLQFSQKQIAQIQQSRVKLFGQPPKDDKKKKAAGFFKMFQKKKK